MPRKPKILITNDDGIDAPGLAVLVESMKQFGQIAVIAPQKPMSG
ncbi:MAG: 5'/3'-nucleotidase SurE, partial [Bacteroidetes bacterium]|nr:5'/3'-nucleotidase SurE [Bacteroidota bacterium]